MAFIAAAGAALGGAFTTAAGATAGAITTATGVTVTTAMVTSAAVQIAAGVALSAISRALLPKAPGAAVSGTRINITLGEDAPQTFILGEFATAGDLVYANSWGDPGDSPSEYYVQVIESADFPARMQRVWINGEWADLKPPVSGETDRGNPVKGYERDGHDRLYVRYHDGTQTVADAYLLAKFDDDPDRPWRPDMIGRGIPYIIVTAGARGDVHRQKPEVRVELEPYGHYDRREDSSNGGSGPQRWGEWQTWRPTRNPIVMIDNILRGMRDPITNEFVWGGQEIGDVNLPASVWIAAMNECDRLIERADGGWEKQYRAGYEIRTDQEPAAVIEELLKACQGLIANVAGEWHVRAGPPGPPVYAFTDAELLVTSPEEFKPFPGLNDTYNEAQATYPEPEEGWAMKDAPRRANAAFLEADGGRVNAVGLTFAAVPFRKQVQRLMKSALKDERRFRRHTFSLPPDARPLTPLDSVSWTSESNGYEGKDWMLPLVRDMPDGTCGLGLQEEDPSDYDWNTADELDDPVGWQVRPPRVRPGPDFAVYGDSIKDSSHRGRRAAIRLEWKIRNSTTAIRYRVRRAGSGDLVPTDGMSPRPKAEIDGGGLSARGEALTAAGEAITYARILNLEDGAFMIAEGILPLTAYEVQARYEPVRNWEWSDWLPVTTPDTRLLQEDLDETIIDKVNEARDYADAAGERSQEAYDKATETAALVGSYSAEMIADLHALATEIGNLDIGTVQEIRGIAVAGARRGWVRDPYFDAWTAGTPDWWTAAGAAYMARTTDGFYPASLTAVVPGGSVVAQVVASSRTTGQASAADLTTEYVALSALLRITSGTVAGSRLRIEWRDPTSLEWVKGHALGLNEWSGGFATWGFVVDANRMQSKEVVFKRPIPIADGVRVNFYIKELSAPGAVTMRIDYLDMRPLGEAEVAGYLANGFATASINSFAATITGPGGALAAQATTLRAEFGAADAAIVSTQVALTNEIESFAGQLDSISASFGGNNLVSNGTLADGPLAAGVDPQGWSDWDTAFSVIARGSTSEPAVQAAPTRYIGRIIGDGTLREAKAHGPVKVKAGNVVKCGLQAAGSGTGINFQIGLRIRLLGPDAVTAIASPLTATMAVTSSTWVNSNLATFTIPAGVSYFEAWVHRPAGGGSSPAFFTGVESRAVDEAALARAETAIATSATASQAVATMQTTVNASFGSFSAFVSETATAVATAEMAASAYVVRSTAGGGSAGFRLVAWDDEDGTGGAFLVDAPYLIQPGTISAGEIVVTDLGYNLVPDNQLQSATAWKPRDGFEIDKTAASPDADSAGMVRWVHQSGSGVYTMDSQEFPVRAADKLTCEFQVHGDASYLARARLRFFGRSGGFVGTNLIAEVTDSGTTLRRRSDKITVPSGSFTARWRWEIEKPGTADNVRFYAPSVVKQSNASVLITPDGAFMDELTAQTAWIVTGNIQNANITTAKIDGFAVTDDADLVTVGTQNGVGSFVSYDSIVVNLPNAGTRVTAIATIDLASVAGGDGDWEIVLTEDSGGSDQVMSGGRVIGDHHQCSVAVMGFRTITGTGNVRFRIRQKMDSNFSIKRASLIVMQRKR